MAKKFDLVEYIKRNLINGYKDGTWTESKVSQLALGYMEKEYITVDDIADIDAAIKEYQESLEKADISDDEEITGP